MRHFFISDRLTLQTPFICRNLCYGWIDCGLMWKDQAVVKQFRFCAVWGKVMLIDVT